MIDLVPVTDQRTGKIVLVNLSAIRLIRPMSSGVCYFEFVGGGDLAVTESLRDIVALINDRGDESQV